MSSWLLALGHARNERGSQEEEEELRLRCGIRPYNIDQVTEANLTHVGIKLNIGIQPGLSNPVPSSVEVFSFSPPLTFFLPPSALCIEYYCFCRNGTWMEEKGRTERKRHFFSSACHVVVMEGKEGERTFFDKNKKRLSL